MSETQTKPATDEFEKELRLTYSMCGAPGLVALAREQHATIAELLAALKAVSSSHANHWGGSWDAARAAIKKAEGRS